MHGLMSRVRDGPRHVCVVVEGHGRFIARFLTNIDSSAKDRRLH